MNNSITIQTANDSPLAVRANRAQFPRIKDTAPKEGVMQMVRILNGTQIYANRRLEKAELQDMAKALYAELMADDFCKGTKSLAWVDVQRAIRRGILGAGKEMYGISVATLYQAILDYLEEVVKPAQQQLRQAQQKKGVEVTTMASAYAAMMAKANEERTKQE